MGDASADHNHLWVKKIYQTGQHISNGLPTFTNDLDGQRIALFCGLTYILRPEGFSIVFIVFEEQGTSARLCAVQSASGNGRSTGDGFQTAHIPTTA